MTLKHAARPRHSLLAATAWLTLASCAAGQSPQGLPAPTPRVPAPPSPAMLPPGVDPDAKASPEKPMPDGAGQGKPREGEKTSTVIGDSNNKKEWFYAGPQGFWFSGEYLLWWQKPSPLATVVATRQATPTSAAVPVLGGGDLSYGPASGFRVAVGSWINDEQTIGVEAGYQWLGVNSITESSSVIGHLDSPILSVPFSGKPNEVVGQPPAPNSAFGRPGLVALGLQSRLQGIELNAAVKGRGLTWLGGFRWVELAEDFTLDAMEYNDPQFGTSNGSFTVIDPKRYLFLKALHDRNRAVNDFYGGTLGFRTEQSFGNAFVALTTKASLGVIHSEIELQGTNTTRQSDQTITSGAGGLYNPANPANGSYSSRFSQNVLGVLPEINVTAGYQITRHLEAYVGYSYFYMNSVYRPADQVNGNFGAGRPPFLGKDTEFWMHGLNFGLDFSF